MSEGWNVIIRPSSTTSRVGLKRIWKYKDLLGLFVYRDFVAMYKQTVLGPIWYVIQPILTTLTYWIVFGRIAQLSTDGIPQFLFYLGGVTIWGYFASCINRTSNTFGSNASLFGKVYFPRILVPISSVVSNFLKFGVQLILFFVAIAYYHWSGFNVGVTKAVLLLPFLFVMMAGLGLGLGILISSITTKYRDFQFFVQFGVQLLMFLSPVIYPLSSLSAERQAYLLYLPTTSIIEAFKYATIGTGYFSVPWLMYSLAVTVLLLIVGARLFAKIERKFMDTV